MFLEAILLGLVVFFLWQNLRKPAEYPPGPWGIPLFGSIPLSKKSPDQLLMDLHQKHGDIASWRIGTKLMVFIFDTKLMKETFGGIDAVDRPDVKLLTLLIKEPKLGVIASNGLHWHQARRFGLRHLRDLGMGKSRFTSAVQHEAMELVKDFKTYSGTPVKVPNSLTIAILNVVWQLVAAKRFNMDDKEISYFRDLMSSVLANGARIIFTDYFPWVKYVVPDFILCKLTKEDVFRETAEKLAHFIEEFVIEHQKSFNPDDPKDFIDDYLVEMNRQKDNPESFMSIDDLTFFIADFFFAGFETTTTTIEWAMLYLANYPQVQEKLQKEIDEVLPKGTLATLEDRKRLPYTEAFTHEVLRASSLTALGGIHTATKDFKVGGYLIPKGAYIVGATGVCHYIEKNFDSPKVFRPERFLDSDGKFVNPKENFAPFGIGRRQCLGEALARMELLIFLTTMVQNLNFSAPPQKYVNLNWQTGNPFMHLPNRDQKIIITPR